mmetsp:Transcript_73444/g.212724  ORF Transcript_73444/g.212724 Transcript_73444/m.212724 type:complete len:162 (+) Transcript_73444:73-558(+)
MTIDPQEEEAAGSSGFGKCSKCSRKARKGCTQSVCLKCCTDLEHCSVHREQREQAAFREQVLEGTTEVQLALKSKQSRLINKGRFHETGFTYMGDTVIIWNLRDYLQDPKRKEDALRKSSKRMSLQRVKLGSQGPMERMGRRKRFRKIMQQLYQQNQAVKA